MRQEEDIKVLIIDDDEEDAELLQLYLGRCQRVAINSEQAADLNHTLAKLGEGHFDVILLDNRLGGGITARQALESFGEENIDVPVVIVTGQGDEQIAVELMKMGAYDYITKASLTSETLEKTILNTIERHALIIKQERTNREVRQQKELLANVISNIPHFVFWKDRDSVYLGCNENFASVAGVGCSENIVGKTDYDLECIKGEADFLARCDKEVMEGGRAILNTEEPRPWLDDEEGTLLVSRVPLRDLEGNVIGLLGICADVTERKKTEQALKNLNEELEATVEKLALSNRELQDLAHVMAHDLKAPLRAIGTLADWISTGYSDKLDKPGQEQIKLLVTRAERMSKLVDGILRYSELRHSREKVEEVDLNTLLTEVICRIDPPENIEMSIESELPSITCEKTRIMQVFENLLSNAIKYMDKPKGRIRISCVEEDNFWKFSVNDNGPGIDEKYFEKIFKIFQTLSPRDEVESVGIGLTVAKKIVGLYGGNIWVESEAGNGSTFSFTLPKQEKDLKDTKLEANVTHRR